MIPKECKRLAEVDFPIARVGKFAVAEKKVFRNHPQAFHQWWARRPLVACRAMLLALLLPDPVDKNCPDSFKSKAKEILSEIYGRISLNNKDLQQGLLKFISDFADWESSTNQVFVKVAKSLISAVHDEQPLVVDPFAGGGSIPLEALRIGCQVFASDLNPIPGLILKCMIEDMPRNGHALLEEFSIAADNVLEELHQQLKEFYPKDKDGGEPIACLWARTVRCEAPNCGYEIPLIRSMWLSKKRKKVALKVSQDNTNSSKFKIKVIHPAKDNEVQSPIVSDAKATCPQCKSVLTPQRIRVQLSNQNGGANVIFDRSGRRIGGAIGLAIVRLIHGRGGRDYRAFTENDYKILWSATRTLENIIKKDSSLLPTERINPTRPSPNARGLSAVTRYGISEFHHLFSMRQLLLMVTTTKILNGMNNINESIRTLLSFALSRLADRHSSLVGWDTGGETCGHVFGRQALQMRWDFAESNPLSDSSGSLSNIFLQLKGAVQSCLGITSKSGSTQIADACAHPLPDETADVWFTDPPYYDSVPYADLSDYFYVWLKRALQGNTLVRDPFDSTNILTPKRQECVWNSGHVVNGKPKDSEFFETSMRRAFMEGGRILRPSGIGCVVFAHKTTEGWEALLSGMIHGGFVITASWPISTERARRLLAINTAALATSVHLVCRPRPDNAPVGDWGEVLRELPKRVGDWMERLQGEGIRGADLVFACIGPALEIFSRYSKVETADGREVKLAEYLEKVWEVVGRTALEQILGTAEARARNGAAGALEEDARLTALFLWTLQSTNGESATKAESNKDDEIDADSDEDMESAPKSKAGGFSLVFDVARRFAQPLGVDLGKWEGRIIETDKGVVRLLAVSERAKQLFGDDGADVVADLLERDPDKDLQQLLFPELSEEQPPKIRGRGRGRRISVDIKDVDIQKDREATTLDRVHAAMLLQANGQANALRALIKAEQERGHGFLRLANALSALYPTASEEKRLLDAMLLAVPR